MTKREKSAKQRKWIKECWDYHSQFISELDVAVDWGDFESEWARCWCCGGSTGKVQKCHVVAESLGGSNLPENIIPLCALCHDEAPDVDDRNEIFRWIKYQQNPLSGLGMGHYWHLWKFIADKTQGDVDMLENLDQDKLKQCMRDAHARTSYHFKQTGAGVVIKKSTREWYVGQLLGTYRRS
jgi:hypothetical protein